MMQDKTLLLAATWAALIAFCCVVLMGVLGQTAQTNLQPSLPPGPASDFVQPINEHPAKALRFFADDSLFVLSYTLVFAGLYDIVARQSVIIARIGLTAGLLTALLDASENAFFIVYAGLAFKGVPLTAPDLPLIYLLTNLKWMAAFATLYSFGWIWPRRSRLDWTISALLLLFPLVGVLGIAWPELLALRGLFFLIGMPLFAGYFWRQIRA